MYLCGNLAMDSFLFGFIFTIAILDIFGLLIIQIIKNCLFSLKISPFFSNHKCPHNFVYSFSPIDNVLNFQKEICKQHLRRHFFFTILYPVCNPFDINLLLHQLKT